MTELNEARRKVAELRTTLSVTERDLSDIRFALGGGGSPSALARRLGVQAYGLVDASEDLKALARLKPMLVTKLETTELQIQVQQARVVELEAAEPSRRANEVKGAKAALKILPRFARAGLEADQALRAFVAANLEMKAVAREMADAGHPIAGSENMRVAFSRVIDTAFSTISSAHVRSPGSSTYDLLTASWAENARLRLEALISASEPAEAA